MIGLPCGEEMLIRFDTIPERDGQTDGRTDRIPISMTRTKKYEDRLLLCNNVLIKVTLSCQRHCRGTVNPLIAIDSALAAEIDRFSSTFLSR